MSTPDRRHAPSYPRIVSRALADVDEERQRQDAKWGEQDHPDGTGHDHDELQAALARDACQRAFADGAGTWRHILWEEVAEAFAEYQVERRLRAELVQVAAVAVAWIEAIDRRGPS